MSEEDWAQWARDTLSFLGVPQETSANYSAPELRLALSHRTGVLAGTVARTSDPHAKTALVPRVWEVLEMAVEAGVFRGWNAAHKHNDNPEEEAIRDNIVDHVKSAIADWFAIPDQH